MRLFNEKQAGDYSEKRCFQSGEILEDLETNGFGFWQNIKKGHRGLDTADWGTSFFVLDWVKEKLIGKGWSLAGYSIGQWGGRQDVYVLKKDG